ncbi:four helix bundle protein [Planctomycetes bacterium TBK1r]|uniref:Four helix bundle protein n=1 Tax=Stieleria magnilauensis TaxID=2527963 RepID=A0ABX5XV80_9BACT|nr:hypothetical protein TBK1r_27110 [Planctomycetes bacterium TBK1r]
MGFVKGHRDLIVYQRSFAAGKRVFELSKAFPREEMYSLTDQVRRSSRSVSANTAEAWRKRRFEKHFRSTLNIAEDEAAETQVWIEYAAAHGYLDASTARQADEYYEEIIKMLVAMILKSDQWCSVSSNSKSSPTVKESSATYESEAARLTKPNSSTSKPLPTPRSQLPTQNGHPTVRSICAIVPASVALMRAS